MRKRGGLQTKDDKKFHDFEKTQPLNHRINCYLDICLFIFVFMGDRM